MVDSPCGNYGDITLKGYVSATDPLVISAYVNGIRTLTPEQLIRADVDGDGKVTIADARLITDYVDGKITTFPVCDNLYVSSFVIPCGATLKVAGVEVI